jgi:hypothetical protein
MSQSFVQIYVHIVFHTKDNVKLIREDIEDELFSYLGGFSVSNSGVDAVRRYILNQKKHHEKVSFKDEYKNLLEAYGIPYEDRYL